MLQMPAKAKHSTLAFFIVEMILQPSGANLALVIGNGNYSEKKNQLDHAVDNAQEFSDKLTALDFQVTFKKNAGKLMKHIIAAFIEKIKNGDLVLFYFCGHGCQADGTNFFMHVDDSDIADEADVPAFGIDVEKTMELLARKVNSNAMIFIADCSWPYTFKGPVAGRAPVNAKSFGEMKTTPDGAIILLAGAPDETPADALKIGYQRLFTKQLIETISQENISITNLFRSIGQSMQSKGKQAPRLLTTTKVPEDWKISLNDTTLEVPNCVHNGKWESNAYTIAGGYGPGSACDMLHYPKGIRLDADENLLIADSSNHRIVKYYSGAKKGIKIDGNNISGYGDPCLCGPSGLNIHKPSKTLVICDYHNMRVITYMMRLCKCGRKIVGNEKCCEKSPKKKTFRKTVIRNIKCGGVAIDKEGNVYVSDTNRHEVRRYNADDWMETVVAGGKGQGSRSSQLNHPTYIFVGNDQSVYVSDTWNDRVMRWRKGAKEGTLVAGGHGKGDDRNQLFCPTGLLVDQFNAVYVADYWNHRVMRWRNGDRQGTVIAGGHGPGDSENQLNNPEGIAFDPQGNLYIADSNNHRIQKFYFQKK
ncbi:unnamed protein product [Rotaria socialis]|uniref:Peptidase C14 caspase domain-containing protein n=5 Tax=Rotaria socialis TaxID=392032 RepID=A0A817VZ00_9BILA|nr:unnamed protein product [Rotaria socialis]